MNSVRVDDWTPESAIIARNNSMGQVQIEILQLIHEPAFLTSRNVFFNPALFYQFGSKPVMPVNVWNLVIV